MGRSEETLGGVPAGQSSAALAFRHSFAGSLEIVGRGRSSHHLDGLDPPGLHVDDSFILLQRGFNEQIGRAHDRQTVCLNDAGAAVCAVCGGVQCVDYSPGDGAGFARPIGAIGSAPFPPPSHCCQMG